MSKEYVLYHFTRAFADDIQSRGLRILNFEEHCKYVYSKIPKQEKYLFDILLQNCRLERNQHDVRVGVICLTTLQDDPGGVDDLVRYFGGEYVRRILQLNNNNLALKVLQKLGTPLRIKVKIPGNYLNEYSQYVIDSGDNIDVFAKQDIEPSKIISIDRYDKV